MFGTHVESDLALGSVSDHIGFQTSWAKTDFHKGLLDCSASPTAIKRRQLPLLALYTEKNICQKIQSELSSIQPSVVDDALAIEDNRITESVGQVLWKKDSIGNFLNSSPFVLNTLITWRTLILPGFAILMPLLAIVIPYFVLRYYQQDLDMDVYLEHIRGVILKQITVPAVLKSRHPGDRLGFLFESLFIGLTLAMFISSLWNQITSAIHLRTIWSDIAARGAELQNIQRRAKTILATLKSVSIKKQRALRYILDEGDSVILGCKHLDSLDSVSTFGTVWNAPACMVNLKAWISRIDIITGIASLNGICFPRISNTMKLDVDDVYHPAVNSCVSNKFTSDSHSIVTGPNRGGKSTFCKALGLSVVTAQSWGFAWAKRMSWTPFVSIYTALEPYGKLGEFSTFESEIEFAKAVLETKERPCFVMMDEIFHSTNADDGVAASKVFMERLYGQPGVVSLISTHYKELASTFADKAQTLQLQAFSETGGRLTYTYKVIPGISDKSSVMEILSERGLLISETAVAPTK